MIDAFEPAYMQRALVAILALSLAAGLIGAWVVLRGLAFFAHAVGTATFPGTVVAGPWGLAPPIAALGAAIVFCAALVTVLRDRRLGSDAATGILVVAALALGSILASDVYPASAGVDTLLFGSVLALKDSDLRLAAATAFGVVAMVAIFGRAWTATAFDRDTATSLGVHPVRGEWALLLTVTVTVVAMLPIVGTLLSATLLIVPAATVRLATDRVATLAAAAMLLAAVEGVAALWIAAVADLPPGPVLAVVAATVYGLSAGTAAARGHHARGRLV